MDYRDIERLVAFSQSVAKKESSQAAGKELSDYRRLAALGGIEATDASSLTGKKSLLYNGGFEYSNSLDINPIGWKFSNCYGVVIDYTSQPADGSPFVLVGNLPTNDGATAVTNFYVTSGAAKKKVYLLNGVTAPYEFEADTVDEVEGSTKACLIQSKVGVDGSYPESLTCSQHIPRGMLKEESIYYLDFVYQPYSGVLWDTAIKKNGMGNQYGVDCKKYVTAEGNFYLGFTSTGFEQNAGYLQVTMRFLDKDGTELDAYTADGISMVEGTDWGRHTYRFITPEDVYSGEIVFEFYPTETDTPFAFFIDTVGLYPEEINQHAGSIETHVCTFNSSNYQSYIPAAVVRSPSYIYGMRAMFTGLTQADTSVDLQINKASKMASIGPFNADMMRLDRGFKNVGIYVKENDEIGIAPEGIHGGSTSFKLYIDLSTI
jgi:hypothetical protein